MEEPFLYTITKAIARSLFSTFARTEVQGISNIPKDGPFILASNHLSMLDPPAVGSYPKRNLYYFARDTLFQNNFIRALFSQLNTISIKRDAAMDIKGMKRTLQVLKAGHGLLLFPEGTRSPTGHLQAAKPGLGMIACKTGVPIIPTRIVGSQVWLGKKTFSWGDMPTITIIYGPPMLPDTYDPGPNHRGRYQEASDRVLKAIAQLSPSPPANV